MKNTLRNLYRILSPRERRQALLLLPLLCLAALVEVVGIASVMPFLAVVADPSAVERHELLQWLYRTGGFSDSRQFLIALGVVMLCFVVGSNALNAFTTWAVLRFSWMRNHTIALRLLRGYLARPYVFFLDRHSSDLSKNLVAEVGQVVSGSIVPAMKTTAKALAALAILALLIHIDPLLAILTVSVLGGAYSLLYLTIRRQQELMGQRRLSANRNRYEILAEAFGGIKELRLLGREGEVVRRFEEPSFKLASTIATNAVLIQIPRFALEAIAFGGIVLAVLYLLGTGQEVQEILPVLGLYSFAGYRLMPSLQQIFNGLTSIRFNTAALDHLLEDLPDSNTPIAESADKPRLRVRERIRLSNVTFRYPTAKEALFRNLNLEFPAGSSVAFVGETGSGKSTLADLILGLLRPDRGVIEIDGQPLTEDNLSRWQRNLGYVPQSIYLTNDTITRNIAFGLPDDEIDPIAVRRAAKVASIDAFIRDELPAGYDTVVGERGVRISGGQRQRIGIARAVYHDPDILVFDEATSSLDGVTEQVVLDAVAELSRSKTILMIAHRLSTVRTCDRIILLSSGEIVDSGTFEELLSTSSAFRAMARAVPSRSGVG